MQTRALASLLALFLGACTASSFGSADIAGSTLTVDPPNVPVGSAATVAAAFQVRSAAGAPVAGAGTQVTFSVPGCTLAAATATLDAEGVATATISGCSAGPHSLTAALTVAAQSFAAAATANINGYLPAADGHSIPPGTALNLQVVAPYDYVGTLSFASSDAAAALPSDISLTAADHGAIAVVGALVLNTPGQQTVQAFDRDSGAVLMHATLPVARDPGAASDLTLALAPTHPSDTIGDAGTSLDLTVTALDRNGARQADFVGTVAVTCTDPAATLPAPLAFTAADAGQHVFTGVVLRTAGTQTLTVSVPGAAQKTLVQTVVAGPLAGYRLSHTGGSSVVAGTAIALSLQAVDAQGNPVGATPGPVTLAVSDAAATAPATLVLAASGVAAAANVTFRTAGDQTLRVTDGASLASNVDGLSVVPAAATALSLQMLSAAVTGVPIPTASVVVVDAYQNPVSAYTGQVTLGSSDGGAQYPPTVTLATGSQGRARLDGLITLVALGPTHVTATDAGGYLTPADHVVHVAASAPDPAESDFDQSPLGNVVADGVQSASFRLVLRDSNHDPAVGVTVTFASPTYGDVISPTTALTDGSGVATTTLTSTVAEVKAVTVTAGPLTMTAPATFVAGPALVAHSSLQVTPTSATADGATQVTATLTLGDAFDNRAAGVAATVQPSGVGDTVVAGAATTDAAGQLSATVASTQAGTRALTSAVSDGTLSTNVTFNAGPLDGARSRLTVGSQPRLADGSTPTAITVVLRDGFGNVLPGRGVALGIDGPHSAWSPAPSGTTDASGRFTASLTSTDVGGQHVTAQVGGMTLAGDLVMLQAGCRATPRLPGPPWPVLGGAADEAVLADLTGDGKLDAAWLVPGAVTFAVGRGDGTFAARQTLARGAGAAAIAAADLDGDGRAELLVSDATAGTVVIWAGTAGGVAATPASRNTGLSDTAAQPLAVGDIDGDGDLDILVLSVDTGALVTLVNNGSGTFAPVSLPLGLATARNLAVGLLDGDARADVAVVGTDGSATGQVAVCLGQANGTLAAPVLTASGAKTPLALATGDLDNDGHPDLVVAHQATPAGGVYALRSNGDGTFQAATQVLTGSFASVALGRLDADIFIDAVVHSIDGTTMQVLRNDGSGTLAVAGSTWASLDQARLVAGDLDGDGRPDIVSPSPGSGLLGIWLTDSTGLPVAPRPQSSGGLDVASVIAADFDQDGANDVVAANSGSGTVTFLAGTSNGQFNAPAAAGTVAGVRGLAAGDLDGDGRLDLVTANGSANTLGVLLGTAGGGFATPTSLASPGGGTAVVVADLDGDGRPDALVGNAGGTGGNFFRGDGAGSFAAAVPVGGAAGGDMPVVADLDGDGQSDLVLLAASAGRIEVSLNRGAPSFAAAVPYAVGTAPTGLTGADVDGDGVTDLVVSQSAGAIGVLIGRGDGTLRAAVSYPALAAPGRAAVADVNNDGMLDVVVASTTAATFAVLIGHGDGTFGTATFYPTQMAGSPGGVTPVDLTGSGRMDLLLAGAGAVGLDVAQSRGCP